MISFNFEYFDSVSALALNWHMLLYETMYTSYVYGHPSSLQIWLI